jgi:hypothetical protein
MVSANEIVKGNKMVFKAYPESPSGNNIDFMITIC